MFEKKIQKHNKKKKINAGIIFCWTVTLKLMGENAVRERMI